MYKCFATCKCHVTEADEACNQDEIQQLDVGIQHSFDPKWGTIQSSLTTRQVGLKPQICGWLHENWTGLKKMKSMNVEGREKTWSAKSKESKFWLATMEANATTPLFLYQLINRRKQ